MAAAFQLGKVPVALPLLQRELGIGPLASSGMLGMLALLGAAAGIAFGALADRLGHRRVLIGGLCVVALASLAGGLARAPGPLLLGRAVEGLGYLAVIVAVPPLLGAATAPADARLALGLWSTYVPIGSAAVLFAAPAVVAAGGWPALWSTTALAAALFAGLVALAPLRPAPRGSVPASVAAQVRAVVGAPAPRVLAAGMGAYSGAYLTIVGFLPTMLVAGGMDVGRAAVAAAVGVAVNGGGNLLGGVLARRLSRPTIMLCGAAPMGLAGALLFLDGLPMALRYPAVLAGLLAGGMIPAAVMALVPAVAPAPRLAGTTQGLIVQGSSLGQLGVPVLVAALGASRGGPAGAVVIAILLAGTALASRWLGRAGRAS